MASRTNLREDFNVPEIRPREDDSLVTETRSYKVITPLFGGGVEAGVNDPVTPIRGTSVRGQLRFWWRACKGGQFSSVEEMKEREDLIWGSAADTDSKKSDRSTVPVSLFVETTNKGNHEFFIKDPNDVLSYAGFPLRDKPPKKAKEGITFNLKLTYAQEFKEDVQAALWAWETFGGIGARTRRGFGCICRTDNVSSSGEILTELNNQLEKYVVLNGQKIDNIPLLPHKLNESNFAMTKTFTNPYDAWKQCIRYIKDFRNSRLNRWPEPNNIRDIYIKTVFFPSLKMKSRRTHFPVPRLVFR